MIGKNWPSKIVPVISRRASISAAAWCLPTLDHMTPSWALSDFLHLHAFCDRAL